ncbi:MAG: aminotransferase class IV [Bacillota bacterium]|nr:aminotransferase class IV [Bacillota bacterium]
MIVNLIQDDTSIIELDNGFYFGKGLFETILVLDKPIFLEEHLRRLNGGLNFLGIDTVITEELVLENIKGCSNCAVKIAVSEKNIVFSKRELSYTLEHYNKGFKVKLGSIKRNPYSHMVRLKSLNYIENILEKNLAAKENFNEVLFLNTDNFLAEGSLSNVFVITKEGILTPSTQCGLLDGVVRNFLIKELSTNYNIVETTISLDDINSCQGMFLTNSLMGLMWINEFNGIKFSRHRLYDEIKNYYDNYILKPL